MFNISEILDEKEKLVLVRAYDTVAVVHARYERDPWADGDWPEVARLAVKIANKAKREHKIILGTLLLPPDFTYCGQTADKNAANFREQRPLSTSDEVSVFREKNFKRECDYYVQTTNRWITVLNTGVWG